MTSVCKRLEFDAAHRLIDYVGKCAHLHGHRYAVEITCQGRVDIVGLVIDFSCIKQQVGAWIDRHLDHGTIVNVADQKLADWLADNHQKYYPMQDNPTAENIARDIYVAARALLLHFGVVVQKVEVWETPTCRATHVPENSNSDHA